MTGRDPIKITLDGCDFKVRPLTVAQIEQVEMILAKPRVSSARQASEIVSAGLSRDHADFDIEDAGTTIIELGAAMQALLDFAGFIPPGEAPAAAGNVPTGETSGGVSPPPSSKRRPK